MANFTYTVLYGDEEVASEQGESFEYCRETALEAVPSYYPREELTFSATCDTGVIGQVTGPCYL